VRTPSSTFTLVLVVVIVGNRVVAKSSLRWKTLQFILVELLFYFLFFFFYALFSLAKTLAKFVFFFSYFSYFSFPRMRWEKREERREKRREASKLATLERFLGRYSLSSLTLVARVSIDDTERVWPPDQSPNSSTTHKVPKSN
jgi:hypothetical protein